MKKFKPIPGEHCESSAILNALTFLQYTITEEQIIGAGAAPSFIYEKSDFPFLGGRSHSMRKCFLENCKIPYKIQQKAEPSDWEEIEYCINNNVPVILRVDMRYLPYLHNGKYGPSYMSFGWHYITLFKLDKENKIAQISDTSFSELQQIKFSALKKARFSETEMYPPNGEYYYFLKADKPFTVNWNEVSTMSLKQYFHNMNQESYQTNQLIGLSGLRQLSKETLQITNFVPSFLVRMVLEVHHGSIETNGTGGAAFRTLYYKFLKKHLHCKNREAILKTAKECEQLWHSLADSYKIGANIYKERSKAKRKDALVNISECLEKVFIAESKMCKLIKETFSL